MEKKENKKWMRYVGYLIGMNLLCIGINLNTRSTLGVASFSTLPYSLSCIFSHLTFGEANIVIYLILVVLQLLLERKWSLHVLLEIPFSFLFGLIVDLYDFILPFADLALWLRILVLLAGNTLSAVGVFLMAQGHLVMAPVDGIVGSISEVSKKPYSLCKNCFDISMIIITVIVCLLCRSRFYGIGVGTIFSAFYVGRVIHLCEQQAAKHHPAKA